jgi:hypothetical protein
MARKPMIGQHDERADREGMTSPRRGDRLAQASDPVDQQGLPSLRHIDREEEASARDERATIVRCCTEPGDA